MVGRRINILIHLLTTKSRIGLRRLFFFSIRNPVGSFETWEQKVARKYMDFDARYDSNIPFCF